MMTMRVHGTSHRRSPLVHGGSLIDYMKAELIPGLCQPHGQKDFAALCSARLNSFENH